MKKFRFDILFLTVAAICFGVYGIITWQNAALAKNADEVRERMQAVLSSAEETADTPAYVSPYQNVFASNEDCIAWLQVPDTDIDYPVMLTPEDEGYYLYRNFFGEADKNGTLFLDTDCDLTRERGNLIIHGHHMKSGAMFGTLDQYADADYAKEHSQIYLYTPDEVRVYEVIAAFNAKVYKGKTDQFRYYAYFGFDEPKTFDVYYENIKKISMYDTGVTAEYGDAFITLSTCAYHTKNGRFAVVGKLLFRQDFALTDESVRKCAAAK